MQKYICSIKLYNFNNFPIYAWGMSPNFLTWIHVRYLGTLVAKVAHKLVSAGDPST